MKHTLLVLVLLTLLPTACLTDWLIDDGSVKRDTTVVTDTIFVPDTIICKKHNGVIHCDVN